MNRNLLRRIASPSGTAFSSFSGYRSDPLRDNNVLPVAAVDYQSALHVHFSELDQYLAAHLAKGSPKRISTTTRKLTRLPIRQFHELSTDVYDELRRKTDNAVPSLLPREEFHPKRNQARTKLATLSIDRFNDLASDVYHELARRYPDFKEDPSGTIDTRSDYEDYPVSDFPNKFPLRTTSDRSAKINHIGSKNRRPSEDRRHTHGRATPDDYAANKTSSHCRPSRDMIPRSDDCDRGDAPDVSDVDDTIIYLSAVTEVQHSTYSLKSPTMSPKRKLEVMQEIDELAPCPQRRKRPNGHLKVEEERGFKSRVTACRDEECGMKEATLVTSIPVSGQTHCDRVLSVHDFDSDLRGARNSGDAKRYDDDDIVLLSFTKQGTHNAAEYSDQSQLNTSATESMIAAGGLLMNTSHLTVSSDTPANVSENDEILVARNTLVGSGHILRFRFVKGLQRRMNLDSTPAFPFSQYRVDSKGGVQTGQAPRLTHVYFESKNERDATVRRVMERLDTLFHVDC